MTILEVARIAGVSPTTVSRVINGIDIVNKETKKRVEDVISAMKYTPNSLAQSMRTKKSKIIGVIIPDITNPYYSELLHYIEEKAKQNNYHLIITSIDSDTNNGLRSINDLLNLQVEAIFVCTYEANSHVFNYLLELSRRMVVIFLDMNSALEGQLVNAIYPNGYEGMKLITQHLIACGNKRVALIKSIEKYNVAVDRYAGYIAALKDASIPFDKQYVFEGNYKMESGFAAAKYFMENTSVPPTAIASCTDIMAIGAMNYLKSTGKRIPEDVAVAGFDGIIYSKIVSPALTTYKYSTEIIADELLKRFLYLRNNPSSKENITVINGNLIIRRSTDISKEEIEQI